MATSTPTRSRETSTSAPVNDAPVESTIEGTNVAYTENDPATQITNTIVIADLDDTNIESAVVEITGNFVTGEDVIGVHRHRYDHRRLGWRGRNDDADWQ